jgi:hypothetical protein
MMTSRQRAPSREDIDAWFTGLLAGTRTRDEADGWAAGWHEGPTDAAVDDEVVWWALDLLHGIDMPAGPDGSFMHDDDQLRQWLAEFRSRCVMTSSNDAPGSGECTATDMRERPRP